MTIALAHVHAQDTLTLDTEKARVLVETFAQGLEHPWSLAFLPDGRMLVTERPGRVRLISRDGHVGAALAGVPAVAAVGQGGLLDVVLAPDFSTSRRIYFSYSEPRGGATSGTTVAAATLQAERLSEVQIVFRQQPAVESTGHFGSRLVFDREGMLFVTLGERSDKRIRPQAQQMDSHMGKLLRITPDGRPAPDNPFAGTPGAQPETWTLGHRNVQAAALDPKGRLWIVDHGPQGGDELNLIEKGRNYGWPVVTYGEEYSGDPIPNAMTAREGYEQPVYYWDPVIAPSGAEFYTGNVFPAWRGNLLIGGLKSAVLVRLVLENDRVTGEEHLLADRGQRIRDVRQGADGSLYIVTDQARGELWRLRGAGNR
jgi:glucose/arabinose dehydrogenase